MKSRASDLALLLLAGALVAPRLSAECSPPHVVHMVTVDQSPNIPPGHFAGMPKSLYRLGSRYMRIEEESDTANGIQGLMLTAEPDSWIVNFANHTGTHVVDSQPPLIVRAPVFQKDAEPTSFPSEYLSLEMGCEQAFFDGLKSPVMKFKGPDGNHVQQAAGVRDWMLVLLRKDAKSPPEALFLMQHSETVLALRYLLYEELPTTDLKLFEKPAGINFEEAAGNPPVSK